MMVASTLTGRISSISTHLYQHCVTLVLSPSRPWFSPYDDSSVGANPASRAVKADASKVDTRNALDAEPIQMASIQDQAKLDWVRIGAAVIRKTLKRHASNLSPAPV